MMNDPSLRADVLWPLIIYGGLALLIAFGMIVLSYFLGQRHKDPSTDKTYESGVETTNNARRRFPAHYYIVAMFFVIFDLEVVFIIAWAIALLEVGWAGFWGMTVFIGILTIVFIYEWRIGALDFGPKGKAILKALEKRKKETK